LLKKNENKIEVDQDWLKIAVWFCDFTPGAILNAPDLNISCISLNNTCAVLTFFKNFFFIRLMAKKRSSKKVVSLLYYSRCALGACV
jgi:hypothetical protein